MVPSMAESESDARIDQLISNKGTDADMARVIYSLEPTRYKYIGEQEWAVFSPSKNTWIPDKQGFIVWDEVQLWLGQKVMQRALYWKTLADAPTTDALQRYEYSRNADILIQIFQGLYKRPNYRKELLQELKIFYIGNQ